MSLPRDWTKVPGTETIESGQAWVHQVTRKANPHGPRYALKTLKKSQDPARSARFGREIDVMRRLYDEGARVPAIIEIDLDASRPYFVTPWYELGTLEEAVSAGTYVTKSAEGLRILIELAQAIQTIHTKGFAHRDLKPSNVFRPTPSEVLVADFGLTLPVEDIDDRLTAHNEAIGSRWYIAPENESGINDSVDQRPADFYAFAKVLYALLAGRQPRAYQGQLDPPYRLAAVTSNEGLRQLAALEKDLLHFDPRVRLQEWPVVIDELEAVLGQLEGTAPVADSEDLIGSAIRVAKTYRASEQSYEFVRQRKDRENDKARFSETKNAMSEAFHRWAHQVEEINQQLDGTITAHCSNGGPYLAQLVADPQLRDFLESNGLILPPQQEEVLGIHDHSNALFVITRELEYANEAIYIASYALMYERQVWLVRTPIRTGVVEQRPWQRISSPMFERFSLVGGPLRPGSASGLAVAQKFGGDTAQLSIRLLTELLAGDAARYFQTT